MNRTHKLLNALGIVIALAFSLPVSAYQAPETQAFSAPVSTHVLSAALWRDRGNILAVLARSGFAITMRGGCRQIVGLSFKPVNSPTFAPINGQSEGVRNNVASI